MKSFIIAVTAAALTTGALLSTAAEANPYQRHYGHNLTHSERVAIARDRADLNALEHRMHRDYYVSRWERMRLRAAEARHRALVYRFMHNW